MKPLKSASNTTIPFFSRPQLAVSISVLLASSLSVTSLHAETIDLTGINGVDGVDGIQREVIGWYGDQSLQNGQDGGVGADVTTTAIIQTDSSNTAISTGGAGAAGGRGADFSCVASPTSPNSYSCSAGNGGNGGDGGDASSTATADNAAGTADAIAIATGGDGGDGGRGGNGEDNRSWAGSGGDGGRGGDADSIAIATGLGDASATASSTAGDGGAWGYWGFSSGSAGTVGNSGDATASAIATSTEGTATANASLTTFTRDFSKSNSDSPQTKDSVSENTQAGQAVAGSGTNGGAVGTASVDLSNIVTDNSFTSGITAILNAIGGAAGVGGAGGDTSISLDMAGPLHNGLSPTVTATALSGAGGAGAVGLSGSDGVFDNIDGNGGAAAGHGGAGGDAVIGTEAQPINISIGGYRDDDRYSLRSNADLTATAGIGADGGIGGAGGNGFGDDGNGGIGGVGGIGADGGSATSYLTVSQAEDISITAIGGNGGAGGAGGMGGLGGINGIDGIQGMGGNGGRGGDATAVAITDTNNRISQGVLSVNTIATAGIGGMGGEGADADSMGSRGIDGEAIAISSGSRYASSLTSDAVNGYNDTRVFTTARANRGSGYGLARTTSSGDGISTFNGSTVTYRTSGLVEGYSSARMTDIDGGVVAISQAGFQRAGDDAYDLAKADALAVHDNGASSKVAGSSSATALDGGYDYWLGGPTNVWITHDDGTTEFGPNVRGALVTARAGARGGDGTNATSVASQENAALQDASARLQNQGYDRGVVNKVTSTASILGESIRGGSVDTSAEMGDVNADTTFVNSYGEVNNRSLNDDVDALARGSANFVNYNPSNNANISAAFSDYYGLGALGGGGDIDSLSASISFDFTLDENTEILVGLLDNNDVYNGSIFLDFDIFLNGEQYYGAGGGIFSNNNASLEEALFAFDDSVFSFGSLASGDYLLEFIFADLLIDRDYGDDFIGDFVFGTGDGALAQSLTTTSPIPVPAAVWLFGSGLIGLMGFARRNKA